MLEIRKNTFSKSYENTFFREFSRKLFNVFKEKNLSGVLLGSPSCHVDERLQIDALLITSNVVCIIDFKNFSGKIKLPSENNFEFGVWTTDSGEQIKGGNSINPFIQLKSQKRRFIEVSNKYIQTNFSVKDIYNPSHTNRVVCFQGEVGIEGKIPAKESLNFFILDKSNFTEGILDIIDVTDKEVKLSESSFDAFKKVFRADPFKFEEKPFEDKLKDIASKSTALDYSKLYDDQKAALTEIKSFLENPEQHVFVLQGTINSGKSYLIPYIQEIAYSLAIQETEIFAASSRVTRNLFFSSGIDNANSIYSYIYGGQLVETEEVESQEDSKSESEEEEDSDELPLDKVPLKKCDNSENALFIVDESQLVSDSYHQSLDLVFGSGYLLKDFLSFTDNKSTKRKVIFIGDPYQLQLGKIGESPLNPAYLEENYDLKVVSFQLLDKEDFSDINKQALNCVKTIKSNLFNSLSFIPGNQISILANEDKLPCVKRVIEDKVEAHILCFSNEDSQKVNKWIKKSIIKTGEDIAPPDLVLFNNNILVEDDTDPFAEPKRIFNGQLAIVSSVSKDLYLEETKIIKGDITTLIFREISVTLNDGNHKVKVLSLENYRLSPKAELSKNELILFKIILNKELAKAKNANPFNKSKEYTELYNDSVYIKLGGEKNEYITQLLKGTSRRKDLSEEEQYLKKLISTLKRNYRKRIENDLRRNPGTQYYKLKNAALLRFGWAMTVHKSMSYKWTEVIFNIDPGENIGKINENHFRWLYTGVSRARQKVNLINYKPITPFDKTEFKDSNNTVRPKDIYFHSETGNTNLRLDEFKEFISVKLFDHYFYVRHVEHLNWQERYFVVNENNQEAIISFSYNGKGDFKTPSIIGGDRKISENVLEILRVKTSLKSLSSIKDEWRRSQYEKLEKALAPFETKIELVIQKNYKDIIRLFSHEGELEIELDYGGDGMISFITAKYYSVKTIWDNFQKAVSQIKK